jgi:hypothetical protein
LVSSRPLNCGSKDFPLESTAELRFSFSAMRQEGQTASL